MSWPLHHNLQTTGVKHPGGHGGFAPGFKLYRTRHIITIGVRQLEQLGLSARTPATAHAQAHRYRG